MSKIISFEDICCNKVMDSILEMVYDLEADGVKIEITSRQLNGILHQLYHLYEGKQILYSYVDTMNSYFATIFTDINESDAKEVTFSNMASGLDEIQVGRLFDRFYTVEAARKSTGLGLAISKTLVEEMKSS